MACSTPQGTVYSNTSPVCFSFNSADGSEALANANISYTVSGNNLTFSGSIQAVATANAYVEGSENITQTISTTGTPRAGYVMVSASNSGLEEDSGVASASFDISDGGTEVAEATCLSLFVAPYCSPNFTNAITLGDALAISANIHLSAGTGTLSSANEQFKLQFSFYEADGVTPVSFSAIPEPTTFALSSASLLALLAARLCWGLRAPRAWMRATIMEENSSSPTC